MIAEIFSIITCFGVFALILHFSKIEELSTFWLIVVWLMAILPITIIITLILLKGG